MKFTRAIAAPAFLAALAIAAAPVRAQTPEAESTKVSAPIVVHTAPPPKTKTPSGTWMKAEVLHADVNSITVSEQGNERMIHTFTYSDNVKTKMGKIVDKGNYQYGDKIKIQYTPGQTVALKIHGKPSKAS
jgi:hypothetical protein